MSQMKKPQEIGVGDQFVKDGYIYTAVFSVAVGEGALIVAYRMQDARYRFYYICLQPDTTYAVVGKEDVWSVWVGFEIDRDAADPMLREWMVQDACCYRPEFDEIRWVRFDGTLAWDWHKRKVEGDAAGIRHGEISRDGLRAELRCMRMDYPQLIAEGIVPELKCTETRRY